jgi:hypothetical protein
MNNKIMQKNTKSADESQNVVLYPNIFAPVATTYALLVVRKIQNTSSAAMIANRNDNATCLTASLSRLYCLLENKPIIMAKQAKFKIKQTRGAKTKWGDYLKAMLAVEVEFRRKESGSTNKAIRDLIDDPIWQRMFSKSKDSVGLAKEIIKDGKKGNEKSIIFCFI